MINVIIIEDEENSRTILSGMLASNSTVAILASCSNNKEAKSAIDRFHPDLVISDVELGNETVFTMLQELDEISFEILFTTGYDKYAIQAIKFAALDYLVKPFSEEDLTKAISRYQLIQDKKQSGRQFDALFHNLKLLQNDSKKLALPTSTGLTVVPVKDIIYCEGDANYTHFFFVSGRKMLVVRTLKEYEDLLAEGNFFRVHKSHLINMHHVKSYARGEGGSVTMSDGAVLDVSRRKRDEFLKKLEML